jgi:plasmid stabilization system protein ParE
VRAKPVASHEAAARDIDEAVGYYAEHASERVALGFVDALEPSLVLRDRCRSRLLVARDSD